MTPDLLHRLFSLEGRVALVTGASGGIGKLLAAGLAQAGARVALTGRSVPALKKVCREIAEHGGEAAVFPADLADLDAIRPLVTAVADRFGRLDILVNCAGMNRREPILEVTPEAYATIMDVNLRSAYFLSQAALPAMAEQGGGKIIHIGSLNAAFALGNVSVYGMTKGAIAQMTKVMAVEWACHNVQVNSLCPGFIQTELTAALWGDERKRGWMLDRVPLRRPGQPDDLVGLAIYLAAPASDFVTGQSIYVDGGFTAGGKW